MYIVLLIIFIKLFQRIKKTEKSLLILFFSFLIKNKELWIFRKMKEYLIMKISNNS